MESMEQTFTGNADFGRKVSCLVARNGDLIHKAYIEIDLPALTANSSQTVAWTRNIGHVILDEVSVEIGGTIIDKHYGMWFTIYNELTQVAEKEDGYNVMIGNTASLTTLAATIPATSIYVPLIFWFNRNPGLALPLIALMYHDVKINISFRPAAECYVTLDNNPLTTLPSIQDATLYIDYIFLDAPERRMFSQMNHEYLIEQLQCNGAESYSNSSVRQQLNFSHPTKEIIWVIQPDANVISGVNRWVDFTDNGTGSNPYAGNDPLVDAKVQLNTHDRVTTRTAAYWNLVQPYNHHTRIPSTGIYLYSFALTPENHQPSGTINMSRIENCTINMTLSTGTSPVRIYPYGVNYNVLRVTSGMGGLAIVRPKKYPVSCKQALQEKKPVKILNRIQILVSVPSRALATPSNCGKLLKLQIPSYFRKDVMAQSNTLRYGNNFEDWTICSQVSKHSFDECMRKVQRLYVGACFYFEMRKRQSTPTTLVVKLLERAGIKEHMLTRLFSFKNHFFFNFELSIQFQIDRYCWCV